METAEERLTKAREIYDHHIMVEMLAHTHVRFSFLFCFFLNFFSLSPSNIHMYIFVVVYKFTLLKNNKK